MRHRYLLAMATVIGLTAACGSSDTTLGSASTDLASTSASSTVDPSSAEAAVLAEQGLAGMSVEQIVTTLDASDRPRPLDIAASVQANQLLLSDGDQEVTLALPKDSFYLSIAPYLTTTHDCYYHSLATCQGELSRKPMQVTITADSGEVLVEREVTTGTNGFAGFWLPRNISGTIDVEYEGRTGSVGFATDSESPTCITTLQLMA